MQRIELDGSKRFALATPDRKTKNGVERYDMIWYDVLCSSMV